MPVKYDFFLTPQPKDKQEKVRYHARTVVENTLTNKDIATEISKRCTINRAEAMAVMDEMAEIFRQELMEGHLSSWKASVPSTSAPRVPLYEARRKYVPKVLNAEVWCIERKRN